MSDKMTCPGCGAESSSVLFKVRDGEPCPFCGLSADAILEIQSVRRLKADEALKERLAETLAELDRVRAKAQAMESLVANARIALGCEYPYAPHDKTDSWREQP